MGAGSVITSGSDPTPILQLHSPVGGPLASVRAEAVALLRLLQEIQERSMVPSRLTVFIDCLGLLQLISRWGRADFWPGPQDIIHFDVLLPLLRLLRSWLADVILVKVKSHSGCYHNDIADECASIGCESDLPQLFPGPQKYGTLQLKIQPTLRHLVSEEKVPTALPSDNVPNKKLLQQVLRVNTWRAVRLRQTIFARDLIQSAEGLTVARLIDNNSISAIRCWMQVMTGTYPVTSYLHKIGKAESKKCPFCSSGQDETLTHFLSVCSKFHDARTAAHNQIRGQLSASLKKSLPKGWIQFEETRMAATGLQLRRVPTVQVQQSGRTVSNADVEVGSMSLGRWQPDLVLISHSRHKIAILEVCRPSDVRLARLREAYQEKLTTYEPLHTALSTYTDYGWEVRTLPWVVGARGLIQNQHMGIALEFLEIPRRAWQSIIDDTVCAALAALAFMHRTRFSTYSSSPAPGSVSADNPADSIPRCGAKRKARTQTEDYAAMMARWKRITLTAASGWS